jgi:hypothetical protein
MFEPVYSVWDYWDGPRSGVAAAGGDPCYFHCEWDAGSNVWSEYFTLKRLDAEALTLAKERDQIWCAWEATFYRGEVPASTHPGLPGENARYAALTVALNAILASTPDIGVARAPFRPKPGQPPRPVGMLRELEVEWQW